MSKRNRQQVQDRRRDKKEEKGREVKEKFNSEEKGRYIAPPVQAKTLAQRELFQALKDYQCVLFATPAGVGKSYCVMSEVSDWVKKGLYEKVYLTRPAIGMGNTVGLIPGDLRMKFEPYLLPLVDVISQRYGRGFYESCLSNGTIEFALLEYIRGRNIADVAIVDECQNVKPDEMYTMITRIADGGKLILIGDPTQCDLKGQNGIDWLVEFVEENPELQEYVKVIKATSDDIVRGGLCKVAVKAKERSMK